MSSRDYIVCPDHGLQNKPYCESCLKEFYKKNEADKEAYKSMPKSMRF